ncbi:DUF7344 domain-containing protein [Halobaculum lipolyticum]|uniref:DUF7344 domain-containing protein n=1 Tax=Halobaculum lipolyticum TaxID=3032001 RepID=A0ABD5W8M7_9EURY|nr:hypothetical protein [Halobaculum sp. DT31]
MTHTLTDADLCQVLSCPRRRLALEYLWDAAAATPLSTLADAVATAETGEDPAPRPARESVYTSLRQTHLPTLERHGLVTFDEGGDPAVTPAAKAVVRRIRDDGPFGVAWSDVYRSVGIAGLFGTVATLAQVPGLDAVDPLVPAVVGLGTYAAVSAYDVWTLRPRRSRADVDADAAGSWRPTRA